MAEKGFPDAEKEVVIDKTVLGMLPTEKRITVEHTLKGIR
jgi:hypothetical protein